MFWRILAKDIRKRKSINVILFLFITLASVFLSSSVNNIMVVGSAVNYYMDYANIPDISVVVTGKEEINQIEDWIENQAAGVQNVDKESFVMMKDINITIKKNGKEQAFDSESLTVYLGSLGHEYARVYDENGESFSLQPGEIAVSRNILEQNKLKLGDSIILKEGSIQKKFTIKLTIKDAAFGNEMSGMTRFIVNDSDFKQFLQEGKAELFNLFYVDLSGEKGHEASAKEVQSFTKELSNQGYSTLTNALTRSTYQLVYSFDMIMAALLILIGICLILIAMLVLRFTLVFTIEEDYREIGIMKAIGFRQFDIKKIYLVKYLFLVVLGALLGLVISIPVSGFMVDSVAANMIMEDEGANLWLNVLCTLAIILLVLLFCYRCTHKMNKISAIAAIRGGQIGERYSRKAGIRLSKWGRLPVPFFLGLNDMMSHLRRYLILILTFCLSFILITVPLNTLNTMRSREMVEKFGLNPDSAVYLKEIERSGELYKNTAELKTGMKRVEQELEKEGYAARLTGMAIFFLSFRIPDSKEGAEGDSRINIMTIQPVGVNTHFLTYQEGEEPILDNEIAFSRQIMEQYGWKIGDSVEASIGGENKTLLITGIYSDYMQLGQSARMNSKLNCDKERMFDCWNIMVDMETEKSQEQLVQELKKRFPEYQWSDAQEVVDQNVGSIQQSLDDMLLPMTGMLCGLIMLITLLMEKLFIVREKGEIAMMKSVGFRNRSIRLWQVMRMVYVAMISMLIAVPVSLLSNQWVLKPIFGIMGAEVKIQVDAWQVYGVYPGILLAGIIIATIIASRSVKKINIQEMNNME